MSKPEEKKRPGGEKESESIAEGILKGLGKIIPGLGRLIKGLEESPAFKERLKEVDKELEHKLKETPSKRSGGRPSGIPGGIPPGSCGRARTGRRKPEVRPSPPPMPQERPADIFDEEGQIRVIVEIPGIEEDDIKLNLDKDSLAISVDVPGRKYHREIKLPCESKGELEKTYKNGILEVKITK